MHKNRCYLRGTNPLGLLNTLLGCLLNRVLVRCIDTDSKKLLAWRYDYADDHPPADSHPPTRPEYEPEYDLGDEYLSGREFTCAEVTRAYRFPADCGIQQAEIRTLRTTNDARKKHKCRPGYDLENEQQTFPSESVGRGPAIEECHEDEQGRLWARNSEYGTQVNFCPFCGYRARARIEWSG